ncbi:ferredoxin oxidoreductase [Heliophilum fasciatum]|uniref:2-oxoglutarate ferredoxin oxidoreductase subunit alpha n=1 Tax=Heliophilum fasciatum TaxID=35700 RepID=A0A4R2RY94_9FIRM|nr:ferredoxin oxidoreductase [Heliophilum fasciatum]MCW2276976.1 2-oxoglutarate ferredoxin oxidoreductase subunit alpha [Heliophilum fasciatum]TCP68498.1 2-oxoglutarate ferredoxin oxidoreductase subunit alpha [Heliophilum fasciatum]
MTDQTINQQKPVQGEKRMFMTGNEVIAYAALAAGAEMMCGYPITPQNEIMHYWTRLAPKYERRFLQTEDELSAGFSTLGGVLAGRRAFTATAGPGNVLMQEPLSMAEMMRIPIVLIVQQRGGPSTATVIYSQQEVTLTCYGGNGEGARIVYSPSNHQELYDYTLKAFNTAWTYRFPTFILGDGYQAKMRESLTIYDPAVRGVQMVPTEPIIGGPGAPGTEREAVHLRNTFNTEEELYEIITAMMGEYDRIAPSIVEHEAIQTDDAEILILSHGVVSRATAAAVRELREAGIKVGSFRPITLRPFPVEALRNALKPVKKMLIVESAQGQLAKLCKEAIYGETTPIEYIFKPGVGVTAEEVVAKVKAMA